jgi:hypothetical protein
MRFEGYAADGASYRSAGYIELQVGGIPGLGDMPGQWVVYTTPDGTTTPTLKLTLGNTRAQFTTTVETATNMRLGSSGTFAWSDGGANRAFMSSPADLKINLSNSADIIGVGLDFSTTSILKIRTKTQTADASIHVLNALIGAAIPGSGSNYVMFADGTSPATLASNTAGLYADDVAGTVRMFGIDEAGVTGALAMASGTLTNGRVALIGTNGLLTDDADLTFATDTLTAGHIAKSTYKADGIHQSTSLSYISGTGTAGADNTAQTVKTLTLAANTLTQVGDRLRIRAYWTGSTGGALTGSLWIGPTGAEVLISDTTDVGAADFQINECFIHYIDNTHANIIETELGALGALSAPNVAGFTWDTAQDILFTQDAALGNHAILYELLVDVFPKGVA